MSQRATMGRVGRSSLLALIVILLVLGSWAALRLGPPSRRPPPEVPARGESRGEPVTHDAIEAPHPPEPEIVFFTVGRGPEGVAFDGTTIWVANQFSDSVTRLRAADGANVCVTKSGSNTLTKLRAGDGAVLGTFAVGDGPSGVAFDGASIWVANFFGQSVLKLRPSDGAVLATVAVPDGPADVLAAG